MRPAAFVAPLLLVVWIGGDARGQGPDADSSQAQREALVRRRATLRAQLAEVERALAALETPGRAPTLYLLLRSRDAPVPEEPRVRAALLAAAAGARITLLIPDGGPPSKGTPTIFTQGVACGLPLLEAALFRTVSGRVHLTYRLVGEDLGVLAHATLSIRPQHLERRLDAWLRDLARHLDAPAPATP